ncbi:MAG: hypoxanthine phosphoribosyltransferase [Chloroflexota bacterium]
MQSHKTLIPESHLKTRIREMARDIEATYRNSHDLVLVCVLQGAKPFFEQLSAELSIPHRMASIQVSSYGVGTYLSTGDVAVTQPLDADVNGSDVLIVEDIIDTGHSMHTILNLLADERPNSVSVCALLSKPSRRVVSVPVDFLGFSIEDHFVFGYGIDVDQKYRELSYIGYFE